LRVIGFAPVISNFLSLTAEIRAVAAVADKRGAAASSWGWLSRFGWYLALDFFLPANSLTLPHIQRNGGGVIAGGPPRPVPPATGTPPGTCRPAKTTRR